MKKDGWQKRIHTRHYDGRKERRKQHITYLTNLCKFVVRAWISSADTKTQHAKIYKGKIIVKRHDRKASGWTEEEDETGIVK